MEEELIKALNNKKNFILKLKEYGCSICFGSSGIPVDAVFKTGNINLSESKDIWNGIQGITREEWY